MNACYRLLRLFVCPHKWVEQSHESFNVSVTPDFGAKVNIGIRNVTRLRCSRCGKQKTDIVKI